MLKMSRGLHNRNLVATIAYCIYIIVLSAVLSVLILIRIPICFSRV